MYTSGRSANYSFIAALMKVAPLLCQHIPPYLPQHLELEYFYPALNAPHSYSGWNH